MVFAASWVSVSTGELGRLTDKKNIDGYLRYPAWSPTGELMVFEEAKTVGDLWQVELEKGTP